MTGREPKTADEAGQRQRRLLIVGALGTVVTAVCCFTPVLVWVLGALGLTALLGVLDFVLLPMLGGFLMLTAYALVRRQRN